jgi:hypothetical protein
MGFPLHKTLVFPLSISWLGTGGDQRSGGLPDTNLLPRGKPPKNKGFICEPQRFFCKCKEGLVATAISINANDG